MTEQGNTDFDKITFNLLVNHGTMIDCSVPCLEARKKAAGACSFQSGLKSSSILLLIII